MPSSSRAVHCTHERRRQRRPNDGIVQRRKKKQEKLAQNCLLSLGSGLTKRLYNRRENRRYKAHRERTIQTRLSRVPSGTWRCTDRQLFFAKAKRKKEATPRHQARYFATPSTCVCTISAAMRSRQRKSKRLKKKIRHEPFTRCTTCDVHLCVAPDRNCFQEYHTLKKL